MASDAKLVAIESRTPDEDIVEMCERMLDHAKSGELIGLVYVAAWHSDRVSSGWAVGARASMIKMLGEMHVSAHRFAARILARDGIENGE